MSSKDLTAKRKPRPIDRLRILLGKPENSWIRRVKDNWNAGIDHVRFVTVSANFLHQKIGDTTVFAHYLNDFHESAQPIAVEDTDQNWRDLFCKLGRGNLTDLVHIATSLGEVRIFAPPKGQTFLDMYDCCPPYKTK